MNLKTVFSILIVGVFAALAFATEPPRPILTWGPAPGDVTLPSAAVTRCHLYSDKVVISHHVLGLTTITERPLSLNGDFSYAFDQARSGQLVDLNKNDDQPSYAYMAGDTILKVTGSRGKINESAAAHALIALIDLNCH